MIKLIGTCNRCGLCCRVEHLRCMYLEVTGVIGEAEATRCTVHDRRTPGMPILLLNANNVAERIGICNHGLPSDNERIAEEIGKGCSLQFA